MAVGTSAIRGGAGGSPRRHPVARRWAAPQFWSSPRNPAPSTAFLYAFRSGRCPVIRQPSNASVGFRLPRQKSPEVPASFPLLAVEGAGPMVLPRPVCATQAALRLFTFRRSPPPALVAAPLGPRRPSLSSLRVLRCAPAPLPNYTSVTSRGRITQTFVRIYRVASVCSVMEFRTAECAILLPGEHESPRSIPKCHIRASRPKFAVTPFLREDPRQP